MDRRLYMPEKWFREECGVPADLTFHTQPELAWEMINTLSSRGALPFGWVTFDEHFGNNPQLLDRVDGSGLLYLAEVPHDTMVWTGRPRTEVPPAKVKGRHPTRERLCEGEADPVRVDELAKLLPNGKKRLRCEIADAPYSEFVRVSGMRWPVETASEESKNAVLPRKRLDANTAIDLIYRTQHQNYAAYCSHRRHTLRRLDSS